MTFTVVAQEEDKPDTGFGQDNGNWYYYENGTNDTTRNDLIQGTVEDENGWWRVENGKVNFSFTGWATNSYDSWYCVNGKVDFSRS